MKKWNNISDDELDDLFKEAFQSVDPVFEENAWEKMVEKLDSEPEYIVGGIWNTKNIIGAVIILLLIGFAGSKFYFNDEVRISDTQSTESPLSKNSEILEGSKIDKEEVISMNTESSNDKQTQSVAYDNEHLGKTQNENIIENETKSGISNFDNEFSIDKNQKEIFLKKSKLQKKSLSNKYNETSTLITNSPISENKLSEATQSNKGQSELTTTSSSDTFKTFEKLNTKSIQGKNYSDLAIDLELELNPNTAIENQAKKTTSKVKKTENHLYLALGLSPDFSKVIDNSFVKMGSNLSAQLEYHFNSKWSIHSGVIISNKFYNANADGMNWPSYWGSMPKELEGMNGSCTVIDIPVNLRYNIKFDEKAKMYAVTGFSNFFFMDQKYDYQYSKPMASSEAMGEYSTSKREFLPAGMLNFSIGYERKLGNTLSFQIEPFVKGTIRDFGFSQVKLVSTGVFFTGKIKLK